MSLLLPEIKQEIFHRKDPEAKGTSEMWRVLQKHTDNKPNDNTRITSDNGIACVSQCQKAYAFVNMFTSMTSLRPAKEDGVVKRIFDKTLCTLEVTKCTRHDISDSEDSTLIHQGLWAQTKFIRDSSVTVSSRRFLSIDSISTNPRNRHLSQGPADC